MCIRIRCSSRRRIVIQFSKNKDLLVLWQRVILFCLFITTITLFRSMILVNEIYIDTDVTDLMDQLGNYTRSDDIIKVQVNSTVYDCDKEYHQLLGLPQSLLESKCKNCNYFTCKAMLFGQRNDSLYEEAREYMKNHTKVIKPNSYFVNITQNCDGFKKMHGYHTTGSSQMEQDFPIAFTILLHRDLEQAEKLLKAIYRPHNAYCIHIDANSEKIMHDGIKSIANCFDNVFIASKLEHVVYAGYSRLQADINCMQDLVKHRIKWRYLMNVAAQSFPLMTNLELVKLFTIYDGMNDIEGFADRVQPHHFENVWVEYKTRLGKIGIKNSKPPHDIQIVKGSAYGIFSRDFVQFLLTDKKAIDLLTWSKRTWSPDEFYWATLNHQWSNPHIDSPGGYKGYPDSKPWHATYASWCCKQKCAGQWIRGVCAFGVGDLSSLLLRREAFANKFFLNIQPLALECLESWIEYKTRCPIPFDYNYYRNLPFLKNKWKPY